LMVDAISGLTCDPLRQDAWGVDVVVSGSQKGFMLPPGLAFLSANSKAQALMPSSKLPKFYFHLGKAIKALDKHDSPYTPALSLVRGLDVSLNLLLAEGIENVWKRHAEVASWVRAEIGKLGLEIFAQAPSNALTSVTMPSSVNSSDLIKHMRDKFNIIAANGQSELEGKILRFAHMGDAARPVCAQRGIEALKSALTSVGYAPVAR
jgi:aspartate aminotransferase-like enzyme